MPQQPPTESGPEILASVVAPSAISAALRRHWGLDVGRCWFWKQGQNDTYFAETPEALWVARLYRHGVRDPDEVLYELELIDHLASRGIPAVAAVPTAAGTRWVGLDAPEGRRVLVVFPGAAGEGPSLERFPARDYGSLIGSLHRAADSFVTTWARAVLDFDALVTRPAEAAQPWLSGQDAETLAAAVEALRDELGPLRTEALDWGPCHNDVIGNVAHGPGGEWALFDFDSCGPGWRSQELATVALQFVAWGKDPEGLWSDFVASYRRERSIAQADLATVPSFVAARYIWLLGLHVMVGELEGHTRDADYLPSMMGGLRRWLPGQPPPLDPLADGTE